RTTRAADAARYGNLSDEVIGPLPGSPPWTGGGITLPALGTLWIAGIPVYGQVLDSATAPRAAGKVSDLRVLRQPLLQNEDIDASVSVNLRIAVAWPLAGSMSTRAPPRRESSVATSKALGTKVTAVDSTRSMRRPRMLLYGPVMPTSLMN